MTKWKRLTAADAQKGKFIRSRTSGNRPRLGRLVAKSKSDIAALSVIEAKLADDPIERLKLALDLALQGFDPESDAVFPANPEWD